MSKCECFSLASCISQSESERLGLKIAPNLRLHLDLDGEDVLYLPQDGALSVMAKPTDENRQPRRGEWYLRNVAYRAEVDLDHAYRILELVVVRSVMTMQEHSRPFAEAEEQNDPPVLVIDPENNLLVSEQSMLSVLGKQFGVETWDAIRFHEGNFQRYNGTEWVTIDQR